MQALTNDEDGDLTCDDLIVGLRKLVRPAPHSPPPPPACIPEITGKPDSETSPPNATPHPHHTPPL